MGGENTHVVSKEGHTADFSKAEWKHARGASESPQVEVAFVGDLIGIREEPTPGKPEGPVLVFTQSEWEAFVGGAQDGEFDID
jgi:hypothetical protein